MALGVRLRITEYTLRLYKSWRADVAPVGTLIMRMLFFGVLFSWTGVTLHLFMTAPEMEVIHSQTRHDGSEAEGSTQLIPVGSRRFILDRNALRTTALTASSMENRRMIPTKTCVMWQAITAVLAGFYLHRYVLDCQRTGYHLFHHRGGVPPSQFCRPRVKTG